MKTYLLYIIGLVALMAVLAVSIQAHLLWPSIALVVMLLWLCVSLYGRTGRLLYAYRETEKENERLHTRLAEAERQLQYLRQLTENVDTALYVCSTDGRIDWMNHAAKEAHPQPLPKGGEFLPTTILKAIEEHAEVVDGCALSTTLLRIDGQRRLVVALKDVSMLMQRQEMEAWQQLIRVLTHEIMNSLTPIISISETLAPLSSPEGDTIVSSPDSKTIEAPSGAVEVASRAFAVINRRCHALLDFVESYRQLTRIKAPERTTFPVSELLGHLQTLFPQIKTNSSGGTKEKHITPLSPARGAGGEAIGLLFADRSQLEQVLINLVKNAYESGATEVEVTAVGNGKIRVRDNGCGMSPDVVAHAFIPFFTTKPTGTGIGLSLCRQIILKHGGTITVDSQEGCGTTFTITLPEA